MAPVLTSLARHLGFVPVHLAPAERVALIEYERAIDDIAAMQTRYHAPVIRARQAKVRVDLVRSKP